MIWSRGARPRRRRAIGPRGSAASPRPPVEARSLPATPAAAGSSPPPPPRPPGHRGRGFGCRKAASDPPTFLFFTVSAKNSGVCELVSAETFRSWRREAGASRNGCFFIHCEILAGGLPEQVATCSGRSGCVSAAAGTRPGVFSPLADNLPQMAQVPFGQSPAAGAFVGFAAGGFAQVCGLASRSLHATERGPCAFKVRAFWGGRGTGAGIPSPENP